MGSKKYEFTGETKIFEGRTLHRIKRISDGLIGGWIENEGNLSHMDSCFVYESAMVYGLAEVYGSAIVCDSARVSGLAEVYGSAMVYGSAIVCDSARVSGLAEVYGSARVSGLAIVCDSARVSGLAEVYGSAIVCDSAIVSENPVVIDFGVKYSVTITDSLIKWGCRQFMLWDLKKFELEDCVEKWDADTFYTHKKIILEAASLKWGIDL